MRRFCLQRLQKNWSGLDQSARYRAGVYDYMETHSTSASLTAARSPLEAQQISVVPTSKSGRHVVYLMHKTPRVVQVASKGDKLLFEAFKNASSCQGACQTKHSLEYLDASLKARGRLLPSERNNHWLSNREYLVNRLRQTMRLNVILRTWCDF